MRLQQIIAISFFLFLSHSISAQDVTSGNRLVGPCKEIVTIAQSTNTAMTHDQKYYYGLCIGIVRGIVQGDEISSVRHQTRRNICPPDSGNLLQMIRVTNSYAERNPAVMHLPYAGLVVLALEEAYPCR